MGLDKNQKYNCLLEPFETMGEWWIPGSKEKYNGTLKYDPQESVLELKIIGNMLPMQNGPVRPQNMKLIHGLTLSGQYVTLLNSIYYLAQICMPGYSTNIIRPQFIFIGAWFNSEEELLFNKAIYSCHNLESIMGESCFRTQFSHNKNNNISFTLSYNRPEPISFKFADFTVATSWAISLPSSGPELRCSETAGFIIESPTYYNHAELINQPIMTIHKLLQLVTGDNLPIREIVLKSKKLGHTSEDGAFYEEPISLLWNMKTTYPLPKKKHPIEMLFTIRGMSSELDAIMQKWHIAKEKYEPAINIYYTTLRMEKELTVENAFLNLCHVLEAYHRIKSNDTYIESDKYDALLKNIISNVPTEHKKHIQQRLKYGNEITLRQRLKQMYDMLPEKVQLRIGSKKDFSNKIVNTRNYLTHHDEEAKSTAMPFDEMIQCQTVLNMVCKILFLVEAGISSDLISKKLSNFYIPEILSYGD